MIVGAAGCGGDGRRVRRRRDRRWSRRPAVNRFARASAGGLGAASEPTSTTRLDGRGRGCRAGLHSSRRGHAVASADRAGRQAEGQAQPGDDQRRHRDDRGRHAADGAIAGEGHGGCRSTSTGRMPRRPGSPPGAEDEGDGGRTRSVGPRRQPAVQGTPPALGRVDPAVAVPRPRQATSREAASVRRVVDLHRDSAGTRAAAVGTQLCGGAQSARSQLDSNAGTGRTFDATDDTLQIKGDESVCNEGIQPGFTKTLTLAFRLPAWRRAPREASKLWDAATTATTTKAQRDRVSSRPCGGLAPRRRRAGRSRTTVACARWTHGRTPRWDRGGP